MKQFIVLLAVLPIMMIFLAQITTTEVTGEKEAFIQNVVYAAKEQARLEGAFTEEIQADIVSKISEGLSIPETDITVEADTDVKYRYSSDRIIKYKVSVVLRDVIAGGKLLGISEKENAVVYVIESYTVSEKI